MASYEEARDEVTLKASQIIARSDHTTIVTDLYQVIDLKCQNGELINELNGIERTFYLVQSFFNVMENGGIRQYYEEKSGDFANETVEALNEINAYKTAELLKKANHVFDNNVVSEDLEERIKELEEMNYEEVADLFDEIDKEFYAYPQQLNKLCLYYVLANKEAFM